VLAICIGVAATLAWQSYGEAAKRIIATRAPELGWSPEAKQMIAGWVQELGWTKPPAGPEITAVRPSVPETSQAATVAQTAPETVAPKAPVAPSIHPEQVHQMARDLAALRQNVDQLIASQNQMARQMARLQSDLVDVLLKMPEPQRRERQ
jgi:small-conductance mechanosensitive channel